MLIGGQIAYGKFASDFTLKSNHYLNESSSLRPGAAATDTSIKLLSEGSLGRKTLIRWNLETEYSSAENWNYARPKELFVTTNIFSLGLKRTVFSEWEGRWGQGLFQPRFMDDKLRHESMGLIGLYVEKELDRLTFRMAYLPIFIPELALGPHSTFENGTFVSKNPWFLAPARTTNFQGVPTPIEYELSLPPTDAILFRGGAFSNVEWKPSSNTFSRLSYAFKPMPQMPYGFPLRQNFVIPDGLKVDIHPRLINHHVANLDFVYKKEKNEFRTSVAHEWPIRDDTPETWETQEFKNALIGAFSYDWWMNSKRTYAFECNLIKVWGGDAADRGPIESNNSFFERKYQYLEAVSAGFKSAGRFFSGQIKIVYDRLQSGLIYSADLSARVDKDFTLTASSDVFGLASEQAVVRDGFIRTYRGNDRVSLGLSYVF